MLKLIWDSDSSRKYENLFAYEDASSSQDVEIKVSKATMKPCLFQVMSQSLAHDKE